MKSDYNFFVEVVVFSGNPFAFAFMRGVAFPADKISKLALEAIVVFRVEDFGDREVGITFVVVGWFGCWFGSSFVRIVEGGFELSYMENGVNTRHVVRKLKSKSVRTMLSNDFPRAEVLVVEFL